MPKILPLLVIIFLTATNVLAQQSDTTRTNESWMNGNVFPHRWVVGEQEFSLRKSALDYVLTVEQLKNLTQRSAQVESPTELISNTSAEPVEARQGSFLLPPSMVQPVNYEQAVEDDDGETESESNEKSEPVEIKPVVTGATIYASLKLPELEEALAKQKELVTSDDQLGEAVKASRLQMLTLASEAILKRNEFHGLRITFEKEIKELNENEDSLRKMLEDVVQPDSPVVDQDTISETLIRQKEDKYRLLEEKKQELGQLEKEIEFHTERVTKIPEDRSRAQSELQHARDETDRLVSESESTDNKIALIFQELKYRAAAEELKKLDVEIKRQELSARVDPIERDLVSREVKRLEVEVKRWDEAIKRLRQKEVENEQKQARDAATTAVPELKELALRNESIADERTEVVAKLEILIEEHRDLIAQTDSIKERRNDIQNKIQAAGLTGTNGMLLVDLRRSLASTGESHIRIRQLQAELRNVNLSKVSLIEERDKLDDPINVVRELVDPERSTQELVDKALEFVHSKREYLYQIIEDYQSYGRKVSEVSQARKALIDEINLTLNYIDTNALWLRSSEPVTLVSFQDAGKGIHQVFDASQWKDVIESSQNKVTTNPYQSAMFAAVLFGLVAVNRRLKTRIERSEPNDE